MIPAVPAGRNVLAPADTDPPLLDSKREPGHAVRRPSDWTRLPNLSDWWPGDLLLIWVDMRSPFSRAIRSLQRRKFAKEAGWTHAAVYVQEGFAIEAVYDAGVREAPVCQYFARRYASLWRLDRVRTPDDGERIVRAARDYLSEPYSEALLRELIKEYFRVGSRRDEVATANEFICSTTYEQAVADAFETGLVEEPGFRGITVPAMLARSRFMVPVEAGWRELQTATASALPPPGAP